MAGVDNPRTLATVEKSWDIIDALIELDGGGVTELATHLELSKGAVYTHLATLRKRNLVIKRGETYELALHFLTIGEFVRHRRRLYRAGKPEVDELASETGEFAHLMAEEAGRGIYLYQAAGEQGIAEEYMMEKYEQPAYLHQSSLGKAILAYLPDDRVDGIVARHGLPAKTTNTITDPEALFDELAQIRDRGYALNEEENLPGALAIGVPVLDNEEAVHGAVSVSCPTSRLESNRTRDDLIQLVRQAANLIQVNLQTQPRENLL